MPIVVNVEGLGRVNFPDDYTPDRIKFAIENDILPRAAKAPEPSMIDKVGRQVGLTARAAVKGVTALPGMVADAAVSGLNLMGADLPLPTEAQDRNLTRMGLPAPGNEAERIAQDVTAAMAGQGGLAKAAEMMKGLAGPVASKVLSLLSSQQRAQIVGAGGAAAGSAVARESGVGPVGQMAAGLVGGVVAPSAADATVQAVKGAARGARAAIDPFTTKGREQVVGSVLRKSATNPDQVIANLDKSPDLVSAPTTAQAARDEGLLIAERGLASANPQAGARLSRRASEQNAARAAVLNAMAGDEQAVSAAQAARDAATTKSRESAFSAAKGPVDFAPVVERLRAVAATPEGGRVESERALAWLSGRLEKYQAEGRTDARNAYELQKDLGALIAGKVSDDKGAIRLAGGLANDIKRALTDQIDAAAPGFKKYLAEYGEQTRPIDQMEALQDVRARVTNAGTDAATGERILSAAKLAGVLKKPEARADLKKVLTAEQFKALETISADLDRAALSASSGKAAGSNTTQNISTAYVLGQALGGKAADNAIVRNLARPLSWLNKMNETEVQELLVDAMLNPSLARNLMASATPRRLESLALELKERLRARGIGAAVATGESSSRRGEAAK